MFENCFQNCEKQLKNSIRDARTPQPGEIVLKTMRYRSSETVQDFYPTALKGCQGIVFTHGVRMGGWVGGRREIVCPGCISETLRCRKFILGRDIGWECRCATSWSDLDLTFDLAVVTLSLKILSRLYLSNHKV